MPAGIENFHDLLQSVSLTSLGVTRVVSSNFEWKFELDLPEKAQQVRITHLPLHLLAYYTSILPVLQSLKCSEKFLFLPEFYLDGNDGAKLLVITDLSLR